jgi:hypothetical protein
LLDLVDLGAGQAGVGQGAGVGDAQPERLGGAQAGGDCRRVQGQGVPIGRHHLGRGRKHIILGVLIRGERADLDHVLDRLSRRDRLRHMAHQGKAQAFTPAQAAQFPGDLGAVDGRRHGGGVGQVFDAGGQGIGQHRALGRLQGTLQGRVTCPERSVGYQRAALDFSLTLKVLRAMLYLMAY